MWKICRNVIVPTVLSFFVAACGGGGGGGGGGGAVATDESPGGLWRGTVTSVENGTTYQAVALITEAGEARFITSDGEQTVGNIAVDGTSFTATLTSYAPLGSVFSTNGQVSISGTASGTIQERSTFSGTASFSGSSTATFNFTYESAYSRGSSLATIAGTYSESDGAGYTETYVIDSNGTFTGSDTEGCQLVGDVRILNSSYNLYRIDFTVTSCGVLNGDYSGLAALDDDVTQNDTLVISVSGSSLVITGTVPRV